MPALVAIDENGFYYDPNTGETISIYWDENLIPINQLTGEELQFWGGDDGFSGAQITDAVKDIIIGIWGNPDSVRANANGNRYPGPAQSPSGVRVVVPPVQGGRDLTGSSSGDGFGIRISTQTLIFAVGGFLLFYLGMQRGGGRR